MMIRRATCKRINEIYCLWKALEDFYKNKPTAKEEARWKKEALNFINKPRKGGFFIAIDNGQIIGYLSYYFVKGRRGPLKNCIFLNELYVKPKFRKLGVATRLIRSLFKIQFPIFVTEFVVTAHPKATKVIKLYKKVGFEIRGKTKEGNVKLKKSLVQ